MSTLDRRYLGMAGPKIRAVKMSTLDDLPEALFRCIMLKLPIRSLLVARAVCKSWNLFLSNDTFLADHDAKGPHESWIVTQVPGKLMLFNTTNFASNDWINKPVELELPSGNWYLIEASEGLLCFVSLVSFMGVIEIIKAVLIYNPITRASREIVGPPPPYLRVFWKFTCSKETGEWKVITLDRGQAHMMFSSKTGEWSLGCKPVSEDRFYKALGRGSSNPLPVYNWCDNVVATYDVDMDSWTKLEGTLPKMEGESPWAVVHCAGHGTFAISNMENEEAKSIQVFKHVLDKKKWELVSQFPLLHGPSGDAIVVSDGLNNIWIKFQNLIINYNLASKSWRFFQDFNFHLITCFMFGFGQP